MPQHWFKSTSYLHGCYLCVSLLDVYRLGRCHDFRRVCIAGFHSQPRGHHSDTFLCARCHSDCIQSNLGTCAGEVACVIQCGSTCTNTSCATCDPDVMHSPWTTRTKNCDEDAMLGMPWAQTHWRGTNTWCHAMGSKPIEEAPTLDAMLGMLWAQNPLNKHQHLMPCHWRGKLPPSYIMNMLLSAYPCSVQMTSCFLWCTHKQC